VCSYVRCTRKNVHLDIPYRVKQEKARREFTKVVFFLHDKAPAHGHLQPRRN